MNIPDSPQLRTLLSAASLVAIIVGGGVLWGTSQAQSAEQGRIIARLEVLISAQQASGQAREARIVALELGAGRTDERLLSILSILGRIERQLDVQQ
jgi:hypothetical protein